MHALTVVIYVSNSVSMIMVVLGHDQVPAAAVPNQIHHLTIFILSVCILLYYICIVCLSPTVVIGLMTGELTQGLLCDIPRTGHILVSMVMLGNTHYRL